MRVKLKEHYDEKKLMHEKIAEELDMFRPTLTNIELGNKDPSFALLLRIKKF